KSGTLDAAPWADALVAVKNAIDAAGGPSHACFFVSGHASLEEIFVLKQFAGSTGGVAFGWRTREKPQPVSTKFRIPSVDAPNLRGADDLGFDVNTGAALRAVVEAGRVGVLYVLDPGPDGSIGETDWIVAAKQTGKIATLVVQGALH